MSARAILAGKYILLFGVIDLAISFFVEPETLSILMWFQAGIITGAVIFMEGDL